MQQGESIKFKAAFYDWTTIAVVHYSWTCDLGKIVLLAQGDCCTCIMVAVGGQIVGVLAISDPLKPEARGVVAALHLMGLNCHLVTGDNWRTARAVAEQLAIPNVCAECLPSAKSDKIKVGVTVVVMDSWRAWTSVITMQQLGLLTQISWVLAGYCRNGTIEGLTVLCHGC